jgi:biotin carboxyl carrier protein
LTELRSPITGTIWKLERSTGDRVEAGEVVLIAESMKMEFAVDAPTSGTIEILVTEGQSIEEHDLLATIS